MHFEVLVEDQSGKIALESLLPKILGDEHTFRVISYKGIGRIPKDLTPRSDARKRILLDRLPALIQGYGYSLRVPSSKPLATLVVVCDLDNKCFKHFREELLEVLDNCYPVPRMQFCIAIEEGEAWFLGDVNAIVTAYPKARRTVLDQYVNDSICGTWEILAEAIHPGGAFSLKMRGGQDVGLQKARWAQHIAPKMNVEENASPSFRYFREKLRTLAQM